MLNHGSKYVFWSPLSEFKLEHVSEFLDLWIILAIFINKVCYESFVLYIEG